jgi:hypothetical protein
VQGEPVGARADLGFKTVFRGGLYPHAEAVGG